MDDNPYQASLEIPLRSGREQAVSAWRDGPYLVLRRGSSMPLDRCLVCNAPAEGRRLRVTLRHPLSKALLLACASGVFALVVLLFVENARPLLSLCQPHLVAERNAKWLFRAILTLGLVSLFVLPFLAVVFLPEELAKQGSVWMAILGLLVIAVAVVYAGFRSKQIRAKKVDRRFLWVENVHEDYLSEMPEIGADC